ncbi:carbohydrate kinase family protein [Cohnella nanjingensis]|uniref:Carbohydrate kinase family protein n=2 Tax=Cohnella nanjingensis TaxID=1387779 RepID=A0A7X0VE94_9BACL|nr:carbohydrate kinase family protein [Cohnella nanjingensis]
MDGTNQGIEATLVPGKLALVGPAHIGTGGAVSNTGLALHRLGVRVSLMGKVGDDLFGGAVLDTLRSYDEALAEGMIRSPGEHTSYTVVVSPPETDRIFLHCTGANDTFAADDLAFEAIDRAKLFHFGYPPLMRRMYANAGAELEELLARVKASGATVSVDLARPDPDSEAGRADWPTILRRALPGVDLFLPSLEEILYMLRKEQYEAMAQRHGAAELLHHADGALLRSLADELIAMGAAVVVLKLGEHGLYLRTTADPDRLARMGRGAPRPSDRWLDRELLATCYQVTAVGTTGAGDCTIAGFLTGLLRHGETPEAVLNGAVAVGACNVERADAVSGVPSWDEVQRRMQAGWARREQELSLPDWRRIADGLWAGPADRNDRKDGA